MKNYLRLFFSDGLGSVAYNGPSPLASGNPTLIGANDGLSTDAATGKIAQLGQKVGRAGDPAILTENREIPDPGGFTISIGRNNGVDNNVLIGPDLGVAVGNDTGDGYQAEWTVGVNTCDFDIFTDDGQEIFIQFDAGTDQLTYNPTGDNTRRRLFWSSAFVTTGFGAAIQKLFSAINPVFALLKTNSTILYDTTGGNAIINMDPTLFPQQEFDIKKVSADLNSITLTPLSGTIQELGAPAASYSFNTQGESIRVKTDGVNFYIL